MVLMLLKNWESIVHSHTLGVLVLEVHQGHAGDFLYQQLRQAASALAQASRGHLCALAAAGVSASSQGVQ